MLLIFALVYVFHGFQTHATPLTTLLAESSSNTTVLDIPECICPAYQRTVWHILWACLATIFACAWVSVHPNIPGPNESPWRIFLRRLELMFWTVIGPEFIIFWAFRQWIGAREVEKLYKDRGWTKNHGHFIQMGGFMLFDSEGNTAKGVLSPERFSELLTAGKIEFPTVTVEEIEDRSKGDGFSKTIALGQTLWFVAQCIGRGAQHLDLTLVELVTLSLAVLNGAMYFLWWNKPLDVRCPVRVYLLGDYDEPIEPKESIWEELYSWLQDKFQDVYLETSEKLRKVITIWQSPGCSILTKILISILGTLMIAFVVALFLPIILILVLFIPGIFLFFRWATILGSDDSDVNTRDMKVPTFYSSSDINGVAYVVMMSVVGVVFGGIHCIGWFFDFPSSDEAMLWRVSSAVLTGIAFLLPIVGPILVSLTSGRFLIPFYTTILLVYVMSRLLSLVEAFISLRHLTPGMLALVKWTSFIPHI